jgi:flagellar basal body-associated protein FliL
MAHEEDELPRKPSARASLWRLLLVVPVIAMLAVGCYNSLHPRLWGVPFFYWYQMLWVILSAAAVGIVFWMEERGTAAGDDA